RGKSVSWFCPTSLEELIKMKAEHPEARIVAGNTEVNTHLYCFKVYVYMSQLK
ncbi:unnamed protein product, partial [Sphacelaria rigidula]